MQENKRFDFKNGNEPILLKDEQKHIKLTEAHLKVGDFTKLSIFISGFDTKGRNKTEHKYLDTFREDSSTKNIIKFKKDDLYFDFRLYNEVKISVNSSSNEQYDLFISYKLC